MKPIAIILLAVVVGLATIILFVVVFRLGRIIERNCRPPNSCTCGNRSGGWTTSKCCNDCGHPLADQWNTYNSVDLEITSTT